MNTASIDPGLRWRLPPLILHPFADASGPGRLAQSSRASLMLQGILPSDDSPMDALTRILLDGRSCEIRMLFYIGKDLNRWIDQCLDFADRDSVLRQSGLRTGSFAGLLIDDAPQSVKDKFYAWGVTDYRTLFARALGLEAVFAKPPEHETLAEKFVRHYYRYADHLFECFRELTSGPLLNGANFHFEVYASAEYARLLEQQWEET